MDTAKSTAIGRFWQLATFREPSMFRRIAFARRASSAHEESSEESNGTALLATTRSAETVPAVPSPLPAESSESGGLGRSSKTLMPTFGGPSAEVVRRTEATRSSGSSPSRPSIWSFPSRCRDSDGDAKDSEISCAKSLVSESASGSNKPKRCAERLQCSGARKAASRKAAPRETVSGRGLLRRSPRAACSTSGRPDASVTLA
mmetsp:Transcript_85022/g.150330  ORF Transcript_85022/g.150330 Transcript_85022/m.150330 type:complete len:203 (-) Transcript_85022:3486-4094(-)